MLCCTSLTYRPTGREPSHTWHTRIPRYSPRKVQRICKYQEITGEQFNSPCQRSTTLKDILEVLRGSTIAGESGKGIESKFWATYKKVSNEYDDDFLDRANDDMGIILTFVCPYPCLSKQV
jgi:hypothetical protein